MCLGSQAAHADWTFLRTENSGTRTRSNGTTSDWLPTSQLGGYATYGEVTVPNTQPKGTIFTKGTITLVFGWTPETGKIRPKTFNVLVSSSAEVHSDGQGPPAAFSDVTVDDGFKTPFNLVVSSDKSNSTYSSSGKHLVTVDAEGGKLVNGVWEVRVPVSGITAQATIAPQTGSPHVSHAVANVSVGGVKDTRSVTLSRGGSNEYTTNEGGVIVVHGDTTYSYYSHQAGNAPVYYPNTVTFNTAYSTGWSTDAVNNAVGRYNVYWNWAQTGEGLNSNGANSESYSSATKETEQGNLDSWSGFAGGSQYWAQNIPANQISVPKAKKVATIKYFAKDNVDGATAEARYELTIHDPIELVDGRTGVNIGTTGKPRGNISTPAYAPDPNDPNGPWKLLQALNGDATHTYTPGNYSVSVSRTAAKAHGWSAGFTAGASEAFTAVLNYAHTEEVTWSKEVSVTAYLQDTINNGEAAYVEVVFPYQRVKQQFRLYNAQGEIRRSGSPSAPAPSIPYSKVWDEMESQPSLFWRKVPADGLVPGPISSSPVLSTPQITGDS